MKKPQKPEALAVRTAALLRDRIQDLHWEVLPSYSDLAKLLRVSRRTAAQAVRLLSAQGLVETRARSRAIVLRTHPAQRDQGQTETTPAASSSSFVYRRLREDILSGDLPIGEVLPKIAHLSGIHRCSHGTVLVALRRLLRESLLHRDGRRYVSGPPPIPAFSFGQAGKPVLLVVCRTPFSWEDICKSSRTADFGTAFVGQAQRHGYHLLLFGRVNLGHGLTSLGGGQSELESLARRLGSRYRGALLACNRSEFKDVEDWLRSLLAFGKPVVWLDRNAEGLKVPLRSRHFARAYASEERAVKILVEYLQEKGHRLVAYPYDQAGESWQVRRLRLLQASGAVGSTVEILPCLSIPQEAWQDPAAFGLLARLEAIEQAAWPGLQKAFASFRSDRDPYAGFIAYSLEALGPARNANANAKEFPQAGGNVRREKAELLWNALHFWPAFEGERVSAIVTPNDNWARNLVNWLRQAHAPARSLLPLVSFDHAFRFSSSGITTVDFGYGGLGYRTFHVLTGILPVRPDREAEYISAPRVVEREETLVIDLPLPAP